MSHERFPPTWVQSGFNCVPNGPFLTYRNFGEPQKIKVWWAR